MTEPTAPEKTTFEREMDEKIARARQAVETKFGNLEEPPAELPTIPDVSAEVPEPPAPAEVPPAAPAPKPVPKTVEPPPTAPAEEPTPVAAAPEPAPVPKVETRPPENFDWREFRRQQRELRKLEKEMEELRKQKADAAAPTAVPAEVPSPAPATEDDPFGVNKALKEVETLKADRERDRQEYEVQRRRDQENQLRAELNQQESVFVAKQPDYYDAINHMVNFETRRFHMAGLASMHGNQLLRDPQYAPVIEKIADDYVAIPDANSPRGFNLVERSKATEGAREISDAEAAQALATDLWIGARRNEVIQAAKASGRQIPEVVWDLAGAMGYQPKPIPGAAAPAANSAAAATAPAQSVAEKIRHQAKVSAAGKSISQASGGMPTESGPKQFKTLAELMAFRKADPAGYLRYQKEMSAINPAWHRDLIA
jgi:uncharacterized protein YfiM (DUF2279 family)